MDPTRTVGATERKRDRRTDGRSETNIPPTMSLYSGYNNLHGSMMINFLWPNNAIQRHDLGKHCLEVNGLLLDGTKALLEPMLTNQQWAPTAFTWGQFHWKSSIYQLLWCLLKVTYIQYYCHTFQGTNKSQNWVFKKNTKKQLKLLDFSFFMHYKYEWVNCKIYWP